MTKSVYVMSIHFKTSTGYFDERELVSVHSTVEAAQIAAERHWGQKALTWDAHDSHGRSWDSSSSIVSGDRFYSIVELDLDP